MATIWRLKAISLESSQVILKKFPSSSYLVEVVIIRYLVYYSDYQRYIHKYGSKVKY